MSFANGSMWPDSASLDDDAGPDDGAKLLAEFDLGPLVWASAGLVVAIVDPAGRLLDVNPTFRRLAGLDLRGQPVAAFVGEGQGPSFLAWLESSDASWRTHAWGILPDAEGLPRDFSVSASHGSDGTMVIVAEPVAGDDLSAALMDVNDGLIVEQRQLGRERRRLDRVSHEDALTGLANRRAFDTRLKASVEHAGAGAGFSLVMLDIDHFKVLNDTYGHPVGDVVLAWVGGLLRAQTRKDDFVARYGGEEFVAILPGADQPAAVRWAERVRLSVGAEPPAAVDRPVTVSLGVTVSRSGDGPAEVLARADRALYVAKNRGRNQVSVE